VNDFKRAIACQSLFQKLVDESLNFRNDFGRFRSFKERLNNLTVFSVLGRVCLDGELPHGAQFFFRWDGDPEWSIGAECLPVLRGCPNISMTEKHGNLFSLKRAF
jgi:hypothetical protein